MEISLERNLISFFSASHLLPHLHGEPSECFSVGRSKLKKKKNGKDFNINTDRIAHLKGAFKILSEKETLSGKL
jgi:hypothetical protein